MVRAFFYTDKNTIDKVTIDKAAIGYLKFDVPPILPDLPVKLLRFHILSSRVMCNDKPDIATN